jgi:hypothetical protein
MKQIPTAHRVLHVPQWVQASISIICLVAKFAGSDVSLSIIALARRLNGLAKIWNILLKGR